MSRIFAGLRRFALALLLIATPQALQAAEQPNVLLIWVDDLGYADLGCYGAPDAKTLHMCVAHKSADWIRQLLDVVTETKVKAKPFIDSACGNFPEDIVDVFCPLANLHVSWPHLMRMCE